MKNWMIPIACAMLLAACAGQTGGHGAGSSGYGTTGGQPTMPQEAPATQGMQGGSSSPSMGGSSQEQQQQGTSGMSGSSMGGSSGGTGTENPATTSPTPQSNPGPTTSPSTGQ